MRAFFIITRTNEMHKHFESWQCLNGNKTTLYVYNHEKRSHRAGWPQGGEMEAQIWEAAKSDNPDIIVYVGADKGNIPTPRFFKRLRDHIAPTVLFCSDAGDEPWWETLKGYDEDESFSVMVALDGNPNWPYHEDNLTLLTPIDPAHFSEPKPHSERKTLFGFAGNSGGLIMLPTQQVVGRKLVLEPMKKFGLQIRERDLEMGDMNRAVESYKESVKFLSDVRITPNVAHTGSFETMHVKGRVVEAGYCGCLLLETKGSPSKHWFVPGVDYMEYEQPSQVKDIVDFYRDKPDESQAFGERLRAKILANHTPEHFWAPILKRCGL